MDKYTTNSWAGFKAQVSERCFIGFYHSYDSKSEYNSPSTVTITIKGGPETNYDVYLTIDEAYLLQQQLDKILDIDRATNPISF